MPGWKDCQRRTHERPDSMPGDELGRLVGKELRASNGPTSLSPARPLPHRTWDAETQTESLSLRAQPRSGPKLSRLWYDEQYDRFGPTRRLAWLGPS